MKVPGEDGFSFPCGIQKEHLSMEELFADFTREEIIETIQRAQAWTQRAQAWTDEFHYELFGENKFLKKLRSAIEKAEKHEKSR